MSQESRPDDSADSIVVDCDLAEPPETVWRALTDPDLLAAWLMPNDIRPEVGSRFTFRSQPDLHGGGTVECEVLAAEPNRLLRYSWRVGETGRDGGGGPLDTVVTFVLTETATGGTRLRLVHSGFSQDLPRAMSRLAGAGRAISLALAEPIRRTPPDLRNMPRRSVPVARSTNRSRMRWAA